MLQEFLTNTLDLQSNIDSIRNIMQPLPYLMHIIKTGVNDDHRKRRTKTQHKDTDNFLCQW
jgi:hypothetical protein